MRWVPGVLPPPRLTLLGWQNWPGSRGWWDSGGLGLDQCNPMSPAWAGALTPHPRLVVALSVTLGLFAVELAGFLSGVSMFNNTQSLLSLATHCSASICLSFFVSERWESVTYWYILAFCSALPAAFEILLFVSVFGFKKKPL
uniref:Transmembrane protein 107 n=1 Tax=Pelusios castaneus TaxID=367368 RepID=A0A8C8SQT4_9SAUR